MEKKIKNIREIKTSDNAGFAFFVHSHKEIFEAMINAVLLNNGLDGDKNTVTIYGEWAGGNIQKGVGVCNLPKSFFIFGVKITPHTETEEELKANPAYWVDYSYLRAPEQNIYNIDDYPTYSITADFKGVVHRFKVKGERHSSSKVKTLAAVDVEKLNSIKEFVDYAVSESRFNQALENIFPNNEPIDVKKMGDVIRWVVNDVIKEEMDTMVENQLEPKEINKYISSKVREMFFKMA